MPPQKTGRMNAVAANGYIFGEICSNIYGTSQKVPLRLLESDRCELPGYRHKFATSRSMAAAYREGGIRLSAKGKEKGIFEKKFIYRNDKAA